MVSTMMTTKGIVITIICVYNAVPAKAQYQQQAPTFWDNVKPGELLQTLDGITSGTQWLTQPLHLAGNYKEQSVIKPRTAIKARVQRKVDGETEESFEDNKSLESSKTPYDDDKAYDEFVKKYFDDSVTDALSASESTENKGISVEAETLNSDEDTSEEDDPITEASKKSTKTEKCKKVLRGHESCLICKNPRNGETSESCSYNKETKPQNYAFEKQKNFRKYRENPKNSYKTTSEETSNEKRVVSSKKPINTLHKSNDTTSCIKKMLRNKVCYHCENNNGEKITKCDDEVHVKNNEDDGPMNDRKQKIQKSQQRIYKRTISYTYKNSPHMQSNEDETLK